MQVNTHLPKEIVANQTDLHSTTESDRNTWGDRDLNVIDDRQQRLAVATELTRIELKGDEGTFQQQRQFATTILGKLSGFLGITPQLASIEHRLTCINDALSQLEQWGQQISLEGLNLVRRVNNLPEIQEADLNTSRFKQPAEILTGISTLDQCVDLLNMTGLDIGAVVSDRNHHYCFSYNENALRSMMKQGKNQHSIVSCGNPFTDEFSEDLRRQIFSSYHQSLLSPHLDSNGSIEGVQEQSERLFASLSQGAHAMIAANYPELKDLINNPAYHHQLARDERLKVTLEVRIVPDQMAVSGGAAVPHLDSGYGVRLGVLLYSSGSIEPQGTHFIRDSAIAPSSEQALKLKWLCTSQSVANQINEYIRAHGSEAQASFLKQHLGASVMEGVVRSDQGQVAFFRQAGVSVSSLESDSSAAPDPRAPIHFGTISHRSVRDQEDPRVGVTRVSLFVAMNRRISQTVT